LLDLHIGRVFLGPLDFRHHLLGDLLPCACKSDGSFFGWAGGEDRDDVLSGRLAADWHEEKRESSQQKHHTVHEAFDEITQHLVGISVSAPHETPQFSVTFTLPQEMAR
jgi:hypothetical protein